MGKPTRVVAKPFRKKSSAVTSSSLIRDKEGHGITLQKFAKFSPSSKISKPSNRGSALKKKSSSLLPQEKKSVTFSTSSNVVHFVTPNKNKAESIQDMLKQGAGALVDIVSKKFIKESSKRGNRENEKAKKKKNKDKESLGVDPNPKGLGKVIRHRFKDKQLRRRVKREAFMKKLELIKTSEEEKKAQKRRSETAIVGDIQPLQNILDDLHQEVEEKQKEKQAKLENRPKPKKKKLSKEQRKQEMLDALKFLEAAGV